MTDIITNVPLNELIAFPGNVRKTRDKAFIDELAASIKAHGLQQNLVVKKNGKGFHVLAGGQRLKALQLLAKNGDIEPGYLVPCKVHEGDLDDTEISLAENVMRQDMHPADQFEAFKTLADKGIPAADIGARFGKSETHVLKLLKLARVAPKILKAYRAGELNLEDVMAFAITDDRKAQVDVFERMTRHTSPRQIRDALTEADIAATDKRVKFVTIKAYEKAGGGLKRDLFSDDEDGVFITDPALLERLLVEKLEKKAAPVKAEGWKWVEIAPDFGYEQRQQYQRIYAEPVPLTKAEQKKLDKLQAEYEKLYAAWEEADEYEQPPRLVEVSDEIDAIENREGVWTPEQLAIAGAVVTIGHNGKLDIERGLVRPEDMPKKAKKAKGKPNGAAADGEEEHFPTLSAALVESLTAHKSAALAAAMLDKPNIALAAVVHRLTLKVFGHRTETALEMSGSVQSLKHVEGSIAFQQLQSARETWGQHIPGEADALWQWCLEQPVDVLLDLLAFCAACTVNAVQSKNDRPDGERLQHASQLATAVNLDMTAWFTPTAENYFGRIAKGQIVDALQEAGATLPAASMKKGDMAKFAECELAGKNWLPEILRA